MDCMVLYPRRKNCSEAVGLFVLYLQAELVGSADRGLGFSALHAQTEVVSFFTFYLQ
jgi:hypothetical protein